MSVAGQFLVQHNRNDGSTMAWLKPESPWAIQSNKGLNTSKLDNGRLGDFLFYGVNSRQKWLY